jgi:hypothetical protein
LDAPEEDPADEAANYKSMNGYEQQVEDLFKEEAKEGWMMEVTDEQAKAAYGSSLHVAALAVVVEKDKIRVVHDGTNKVCVNNRIKVRDQIRSPTAG